MSRVVEAEGMSRGLQVGSVSGAWEVESPTVAEAARLTRLVMVAAEEAARQVCQAVAAAQQACPAVAVAVAVAASVVAVAS